MSAAVQEVDAAPTSRVVRRTLRLTGWLFVVTGLGHVALVAAGRASTPPPAEQAVRAAMSEATVSVGGLERSYWDLFQGFSLLMALLLVAFGTLVLLVLRTAPHLAGSRAFAGLCALAAGPALVISALLLPPPPIVTMGLATVAAGLAAVSPRASR